MNTKYHFRQLFVAALLAASSSSYAADGAQKVITVNTPKFGSALVETWIKKYTDAHPDVQVRLVEGNNAQADLQFISSTPEDDGGKHIAYVGRYALLPVSSTENTQYEKLSHKRLDEKGLKNLFFQKDVLQKVESQNKNSAPYEALTVYSGTSRYAGANAFATYFGYQPSQFRGKRIAGDDQYLLTAIGKDHTGITFNNLSYLFDLQSRTLKPSLFLIPLDIKKEQREVLDSGNLDKTLQLLESNDVDLVPLSKVGFAYDDNDLAVDFLRWIVSEGQQYNHDFGFLTLDGKTASKTLRQLDGNSLANR